ncbi:unnamed protein product [Caenorhabditis brenneri]
MPVSFETPPTSTARESLPGKMENSVEIDDITVADSGYNDSDEKAKIRMSLNNNDFEMVTISDVEGSESPSRDSLSIVSTESKAVVYKIEDNCDHGTYSLESKLQLRGELIEKSETVKDASRTLLFQILLTIFFCMAEFLTGVICSSIALLADSYHMAADVMALIVALTCIKIATRPSTRHGYGWVRAETLGGYFNGIFMCTVCIAIFQEGIGRFINVHTISHPLHVLIVGALGLAINLVGMFFLHGHGHSHGGHGHSHGGGDGHGHSHSAGKKDKKHDHGHSHENGHGHSHDHSEKVECHEDDEVVSPTKNRGASESAKPEALARLLENEDDEIIERRLSGVANQNAILATVDRQMTPYGTHVASDVLNGSTLSVEIKKKRPNQKNERNVNIRGVWLHLLSDALGSVIVMISAGIVFFFPNWNYAAYLDPGLSMCLASIMGFTAIVLVKNSGVKLLKRTPEGLDPEAVKEDLCKIAGVSKVEKLSVWTLCGQRIIASVHVNVCHPAVFPDAAFKIKNYFHDMGVHSTTIEPTFEDACMQSMRVQARKVDRDNGSKASMTHSTENEVSPDARAN